MNTLYKSSSAHNSQILGILMWGFVGIATTYIFGTLLTANGSLKQLNIMAFSGMVLNVVLNIVLIPKMQAFGSAYASLTTQLFTGILQIILVVVLFKLKPDIRFIIQLLVFVGVVAALGTFSKQLDNWLYGYVSMIIGSIAFAILLKLFNLKDLYKIIRFK